MLDRERDVDGRTVMAFVAGAADCQVRSSQLGIVREPHAEGATAVGVLGDVGGNTAKARSFSAEGTIARWVDMRVDKEFVWFAIIVTDIVTVSELVLVLFTVTGRALGPFEVQSANPPIISARIPVMAAAGVREE